MTGRLIQTTKSAYSYALLIKHLLHHLHASMLHAADQEIVYRDHQRFTYQTLRERGLVAWQAGWRNSACAPATPSASWIGQPQVS